jgi:hypothetical protein
MRPQFLEDFPAIMAFTAPVSNQGLGVLYVENGLNSGF